MTMIVFFRQTRGGPRGFAASKKCRVGRIAVRIVSAAAATAGIGALVGGAASGAADIAGMQQS